MTKYLIFAFPIVLAWSCKNDPATAQPEALATSDTLSTPTYALFCVDITQPEDKRPHNDVYAVVGRDTVKVGTIEVCQTIVPEDYAQYEIPADAFAAVGGEGEDGTTYASYLGKSEEGKIEARIGDMYPGKKGGFAYRTWVVFTEEDITTPSAQISPAALAGSYVSSGEKSYVLYLGFSGRTVMGQAYAIAGVLPEKDEELMPKVAQTTPDLIPNFQIDYSTLTFTCAKGKGRFNAAGGKVQSITFESWDGKEVTLQKKEIGTYSGQ